MHGTVNSGILVLLFGALQEPGVGLCLDLEAIVLVNFHSKRWQRLQYRSLYLAGRRWEGMPGRS